MNAIAADPQIAIDATKPWDDFGWRARTPWRARDAVLAVTGACGWARPVTDRHAADCVGADGDLLDSSVSWRVHGSRVSGDGPDYVVPPRNLILTPGGEPSRGRARLDVG